MSRPAQSVLDDALRLPESERAEIAARLMASLEDELDEDAGAAWEVEIGHRIGELDHGTVRSIPWSEARRQILDDTDAQGA